MRDGAESLNTAKQRSGKKYGLALRELGAWLVPGLPRLRTTLWHGPVGDREPLRPGQGHSSVYASYFWRGVRRGPLDVLGQPLAKPSTS